MTLPFEEASKFGMPSELTWLTMGDPCPYCSIQSLSSHIHDSDHLENRAFNRQHLMLCITCGWWIIESFSVVDYQSKNNHTAVFAKLQQFDSSHSDIPAEALRSYIAKNEGKFECMSARMFEQLAAAIISETYDCEVRLTAHSRDRGIDMYSVISDNPWAFQFKRRLNGKPEGVEKVREFLGSLVENNVPNGLFLTTAPRYTAGALELYQSNNLGLAGYKMELIDGADFKDMFNLSFRKGNQGWSSFWKGGEDIIFEKLALDGIVDPFHWR